ncbi:SAM-dependent methyltransferase [Corynebacterium sp. 13CS0277]|uniref:class I SAM-dependent methyltransferase n=1 Tax=Corynebacterium sp. 13CS0277 TaxID=2071994 RepID=UPI000D03DDC6|nr:class I SAM-dependent methyltransferase [Corynebacterium sp. 13CS0277]PRQ12035.1 SAM-dependent methyltransferase [Corynebacterium sp. 13CS0277]
MPTWNDLIANNPAHSQNYAARWERFEHQGDDIVGEARLIDAMAQRHAKILDAGCGQGRIGGYLAQAGHEVTGVDLDPYLVEIARAKYPDAQFVVGDLEHDEMPGGDYDLIVSAGNVVAFLEVEGRRPALQALAKVLAPQGRMVIGFGAGRGYSFAEFRADAAAAGLVEQQAYSTWDLQPFTPESQFLVSVLVHAENPQA